MPVEGSRIAVYIDPDDIKLIDERVKETGYSSRAEYVRALINADLAAAKKPLIKQMRHGERTDLQKPDKDENVSK